MSQFAFGSTGSGVGNDQYTKMLLHFDGGAGSTVFTDSNIGGSAKTWTTNGASISNSNPKFGSGCFIGTGANISTSDHADFTLGSADWTLDGWINTVSAGVQMFICGQIDGSGTTTTASIYGFITTAGKLTMNAYVTSTGTIATSTTSVNTGNWTHFAWIRQGSNCKLYINGVQEGGNQAISGTVNDSTYSWSVGRAGEAATSPYTGSLDEFRLSTGIARWTSNFTPPSSPYF